IAAVRDVATGWRKKLYAVTSLGWRGTNEQWRHYSRGYLYLAALATPLVLSVHSVVSWDFAMAIVPGWHATLFAPYFVAGAIYSGVAMVITLLVPGVRAVLVGELDHEHLQRPAALAALVQEGPHQHPGAVRDLDLRERRDVVRALRDHRRVAGGRAVRAVRERTL